ncbi:uncharacterized protein il17rc [Trichomycterus rosablanca]|uniref:uncharacterized protein il17rc n=1 Tax=Trichomycterus rosablanca TaxID=2290929 RepID=UPI002F35F0BC
MLWVFVLLVLLGAPLPAAGLEKLHQQRNITCSQALSQCTVSDTDSLVLPGDNGPVEVSELDATAAFCCSESQECVTCVRVRIRINVLSDKEGTDKQASGDYDDEDEAAITVRYSFGQNTQYKRIRFAVTAASSENKRGEVAGVAEVILLEDQNAFLGSNVNVSVQSTYKVVKFPLEVCHDAGLAECKPPRIRIDQMDERNGVLRLRTYSEEENQSDSLIMCTKLQTNGQCSELKNWTLPLHTITPCMCFQAWRKSSLFRSEACLFEKYTGFRQNVINNVSLTVRHFETNEGRPALSWDLSAPCRVQAELWLCRLDGVGCKEVPGFRTRSNISTLWKENSSMLSISGTFDNIHSRDPLLHCVMYKLDGKTFGPVCQHKTVRWRWSRIALSVLLVLILAAVGAFVIWRRTKVWISQSDPTHHSQGQCGKVLLIHSSGSDSVQSDKVIRFAELLSELGVSVSLDLLDQKAVSAVGPTPWLHSQLQNIHIHSDKILLLLSHDPLLRTKECWDSWKAQKTTEKVTGEGSKMKDKWSSDVFGSALNYIVHSHLKGSADERFALVQFDSKQLDMPEPLQSLRLYKLPSDSKDLLADLQARHQENIGPRLKRFLWICRASARLQRGLIDYEEQRSATRSTTTKVKLLNMDRKQKEEEIIPLRTEP